MRQDTLYGAASKFWGFHAAGYPAFVKSSNPPFWRFWAVWARDSAKWGESSADTQQFLAPQGTDQGRISSNAIPVLCCLVGAWPQGTIE